MIDTKKVRSEATICICKSVWTPVTGKELILKVENVTEHNDHAVAVMRMPASLGTSHILFLVWS